MWAFNLSKYRSRRKKVWQNINILFITIFINLLLVGNASNQLQNKFLLFDSTIPDYETVLTPADFEMAAEINDYPSKNTLDGTNDVWDSDAMYSADKFEGDIANDLNASTVEMFIRGAPKKSNNAQYNAIRDRRQLWSNARIPYAISSQYSSYSRSVIASAMQEYAKYTCIQWAPRVVTDRDYVYIVPDRGCYSLVGRMGNRQTLSLGNGCIQKGIIIHEMMHAVGFFHEQSRTDRDEYITIIWSNILPGMQGQFEKYTSATTQTLGTEYDYNSIMHYGPNAFTRNGMPTIMPKRQALIGQRTGFSKTDSYKINTLYECPNYGRNIPASIVQTERPSTAPPISTTQSTSIIVAVNRRVLPPTNEQNKSGIVTICRNNRPDCVNLARQGWCIRNSRWMKENCPDACGMCPKNGIVPNSVNVTIKPSSELPPPTNSQGSCEDLRVDCAELAKRRYCITAQKFTQTYCARSCGFCFVPPVTEIPEIGKSISSALTNRTINENSNIVTKVPMVTFWPNLRLVTEPSPSSANSNNIIRNCKDRKRFCGAWKKSGFCQGIFTNYMKKNCASSCGWCEII